MTTNSLVKVQWTQGSCLFVSCRWLRCLLAAPRKSPRFLLCSSELVICSRLPLHAPTFPLLAPSLCCFAHSILLCLKLQCVSDALPSIVSGTDTKKFVKLLSSVCVGVCWLEDFVQVNTVCVATWMLAVTFSCAVHCYYSSKPVTDVSLDIFVRATTL